MDQSVKQLLRLLSAAMGNKNQEIRNLQNADWNKMFHLAHIHNIVPMIFEAAQNMQAFMGEDPQLYEAWNNLSVKIGLSQVYRTLEFLKVYDKLNKAGIQALVVKGVICRHLYPNPYYRTSGDEDILIRKSDFNQVDIILHEFGLTKEHSKATLNIPEQVTTYFSNKSGLRIELHVDLFNPESELFGPMNSFYENAFEDTVTIEVDGVAIHSLSHTKHLLFLFLHCIKHFLAIGFGIRQVCDIVMYINAYRLEVNWEMIWSNVTKLGYKVFVLNLLDIGSKYLGLDQNKIQFPDGYSASDIHSEALLKDIMEAGLFGKSKPGQSKTSSLTFNAVSEDRRSKKIKGNQHIFLRALFPGLDFMGGHYPYCRKHPFLLPVAWLHRMLLYMKEQRKPKRMFDKAGKSLAIGRSRIELLKEYGIIGR